MTTVLTKEGSLSCPLNALSDKFVIFIKYKYKYKYSSSYMWKKMSSMSKFIFMCLLSLLGEL